MKGDSTMNENEIMVNDEMIEEEPEMIEEEKSGTGSGLTMMLVGSALTLTAIVVVKKGKAILSKIKARRDEFKNKRGKSKVIDITEYDEIEDEQE